MISRRFEMDADDASIMMQQPSLTQLWPHLSSKKNDEDDDYDDEGEGGGDSQQTCQSNGSDFVLEVDDEEENLEEGGDEMVDGEALTQQYTEQENPKSTDPLAFSQEMENSDFEYAKDLAAEEVRQSSRPPKRPKLDQEEKMQHRVGETYLCLDGTEEANGKLFLIERIHPERNRQAVVKVLVPLKGTSLADQAREVERIKYVRWANTSNILVEGRIQLKRLRFHLLRAPKKEQIKRLLFYDSGTKEKGVGMNVAFRCSSHDQKHIPLRPEQDRPSVLELFAGCGGMTSGLEQAGFHTKYAVEKDPHAAATLELNHPDIERVYAERVEDFFEKMVQQQDSCYPQPNSVDHVHASPPCQGFSRANRNGGKNDAYNNSLTFYFVNVVEYLQPKTASMENVTGLLSKSNRKYIRQVQAALLNLDYQVRLTRVDSSDFGDPQVRERVFLFASKMNMMLPNIPKPTHGENKLSKLGARDVLHIVENIQPRRGNGMICLEDGLIARNHREEGTRITNPESKDLIKLDPKKPVSTITGCNPMQHYSHDRLLTILERALIQSFPATYKFCGTPSSIRQQIGNAVPVKLATAVGRKIRECYVHSNDGYHHMMQLTPTSPSVVSTASTPHTSSSLRRQNSLDSRCN